MFCSKCGSKVIDTDKFCGSCGQSIATAVKYQAESRTVEKTAVAAHSRIKLVLYALSPIGVFIATFIFWGILELFAGPSNSSEAIQFFNGVLIPLILGLCFIAIPFVLIHAIYLNSKNYDGTGVIRCGNCHYEGQGKSGRNTASQVLAWLALPFFWPITLIYYLVTHKYLCPKCNSSFLGLRNAQGVFTAPRTGANPAVLIMLAFVFVAVIGILAATVLAALGSARTAGNDAAIKSKLISMRAAAERYYTLSDSYAGVCNSPNFKEITKSVNVTENYTCNDNDLAFAASTQLSNGNYFCIDSAGSATGTPSALGIKNSCFQGTSNSSTSWNKYDFSMDRFSVSLPTEPKIETAVSKPTADSLGYVFRTYISNDDMSLFFVFKYTYDDEIDVSDPETILKKMVINLAENGQLVNSSYTDKSNYPEVNFTIRLDDELVKGKTILVDQTPFLVAYNYLPENYSESDYNSFISSFEAN